MSSHDIAQLILQQGQIQADNLNRQAAAQAQAQAQSGQIWGQTVSALGQLAAGLPAQMQQQKLVDLQVQEGQAKLQALKQAQAGQQQANQIIAGVPKNEDGTYDLGTLSQQMAAKNIPLDIQERTLKSFESLNGVQTSWRNTQRDHAADLANVVLSQHREGEPVSVQSAQLGLAAAQSMGLATAKDVDQFNQALASGSNPETVLKGIRSLGSKYQKQADELAKPEKLGPGDSLVIPGTGQLLATGGNKRQTEAELAADASDPNSKTAAQSKAALDLMRSTTKAPNVGSFEDYVKRTYGETPTPEQILSARKAYGQADDRPSVKVTMPGAETLSPEAIEDTATRYRILGVPAIPTRIEGSDRVKIMNEAAKQTRALGGTAAQDTQKQAAFKSDAAALTQMQKMKASAEAFETKALAQADLISDLSKKVNRTQYPVINNALLAGKKSITGDQDTQLLFNALDSFTSEYAKIMNGSTGSAGASSDAATRKAEGLISAGLNKGTLQATLDQMKWEMAQTRKGYDATIAHITERMGGTPQTAAPSSGVTPPPGATVQQWVIKDGKLVPK